MIIVGVDPGGTTGVAWLDTEDFGYDFMQLTGSLLDQALTFAGLVMDTEPDVIAFERFVLGPASGRTAGILDAPRMIAMCEVWLREIVEFEGVLLYQSPSDAKGVITNARMKALGVAVQGDHARDAMRHALLAERRMRAH